jgi:mono/diheme cytochrome c family protein
MGPGLRGRDWLVVLAWVVCPGALLAVPKAPRFEADVQPIFQANCVRCHGAKKHRADLNLSSATGLQKGSESGPVVVPGKPDKSLLFEKVHDGLMPPTKGGHLSAQQVDLIRRWILAGAPMPGSAAETKEVITQETIEPLLLLRCASCHGLRKQEAGLDVRTRASLLKGGKSGPAIVLGKPEESLVIQKVRSQAMPPRDQLIRAGVKPMTEEETDRLAQWIAQGAPEVEVVPDVASVEPDPLVTDKDRNFWAFQSPVRPAVPLVRDRDRVDNPIDAFIQRKLEEQGLTLSAQADRITLLRRATFDLLGLPPTPEQVDAFLKDTSPDAYPRLIDRLLASPAYGERWGQYWLDLAGYADSEGKRSADPVRPWAFRYRDYVIQSLNADKTYDRFLMEQIAGDELANPGSGPTTTPEIMDNLVATGFLRMAPDGTGSDIVNFVPERLEVIADEMKVFGSAVLGLTIHCARCHSHKYDPIPQRDYYRLVDVFKGAYDEHDWLKPAFVPGQTKVTKPGRVLHQVTAEVQKEWEIEKARLREELKKLKEGKQGNKTRREIRSLELRLNSQPGIRALWDRGEPSPTYIYRRGDYLQPSKLVGPGVPSVLTDGKTPLVVRPPWAGAKKTGRRLALARWLVEPDHPLTARVMVNRIWKHHFGEGIVKTLANFGNTGARPSHLELLDWLATEFIQQGWSIKALHRLIMNSATYRQSSTVTAQHEKLDPDNHLLSRMPLRRMEAEVVYDSLLAVAGALDRTPFGPPDPVTARSDGLVTPREGDRGWRRSVYVRHRRSQIPTLLETFDQPQMNPNCVERINSTVASQALHLLNDGMVLQLADAFAQRVRDEVGDDAHAQVERIYLLALSRPPEPEEAHLGVAALAELEKYWKDNLASATEQAAHQRALASYAHTILNTAAFLYID